MFRTFTAFALATLVATPAIACNFTGKDGLFRDIIRIGETVYHEPVPLALPATEYTDANGARRSLNEHLGKSIVVTFWHPDCTGCKVDLPRMNTALGTDSEFDADRFIQISIETLSEGRGNITVGAPEVSDFLASKSYGNIDVNIDPGNEMFNSTCLVATPAHMLINSEGKVTDVLFGARKWSEEPLRGILKNYLANF